MWSLETLNLFTKLGLPLNETALETLESETKSISFRDFEE